MSLSENTRIRRRAKRLLRCCCTILGVVGIPVAAGAQADFEKGFQNYQSFHGSDFDTINLANGNLVLDIPLLSYAQRGNLPAVTISIRSNSTTFQSTPPYQSGPMDTRQYEVPSGIIGAPFGQPHVVISPGGTSWKEDRIKTFSKLASKGSEYLSRFVALDDSGATHSLGNAVTNAQQGTAPWLMYSVDGSGLMLQSGSLAYGPVLVDRNGIIGGLTDTLGNTVTMNGQCARPAGTGDYYDPALASWQAYAHGTASAVSITDSINRQIPNPSYLPPADPYSCAVDLYASYHPAHPDNNGCEIWNFPAQQGTDSPTPQGTVALTFCYSEHQVETDIPVPAIAGTTQSSGIPTFPCQPAPPLGATSPVSCERINEEWWLLDYVILPNSTRWTFTYTDSGQVASFTMPTGATISYEYGTRIACGNPPGEIPVTGVPTWPYSNLMSSQMVTKRTLDLHDGSAPKIWTYLSSVGSGWAGNPDAGKVVVTDPLYNDTVHTFSLVGQSVCGPYETDTQYFSGSSPYNPTPHGAIGTVLKEVSTTYTNTGLDNANPVNFSNYISIGVLPNVEVTTLASGVSKATITEYDTFGFYQDYKGTVSRFSMGELRRERETDWIMGGIDPTNPPAAIRTTLNTNLWEANADYYARNMVSLPCLRTVVAGDYAGAIPSCGAIGTAPQQLAQIAYGYDETPQDKYSGIHGLQTSITHWTGVSSSPVVTKTGYDSAVNQWGMPSSTIDGRGYATSFTYDTTGLHLSRIDYPTTTTWGISVPHFEIFQYDPWTGLLLSKQDENGQSTGYKYDAMRRTTEVDFPDGGYETYTYDDTAPPAYNSSSSSPAPAFTFKKLLSTAVGEYTAKGVVDQLGRNRRTIIVTGGYPILKDTFYDQLGRVSSETNPYYATTDDTYGVTSYTYDALGRKVKEVLPDSATRYWCYDGVADAADGISADLCHSNHSASMGAQWVDTTDELNHSTQNSIDGLGNLRAVYDAHGATALYTYDILGNLLLVKQPGVAGETARSFRTFTYDGMSRLITSSNPETGTICYGVWSGGNCVPTYDGNSNLVAKTDARQITTHYNYDEANRLVAKWYENDSSGTAAACFQYDVTTLSPPITPSNLSGRLTNAWTQKAACDTHSAPPNFAAASGLLTRHSVTAYDELGRVRYEQQCTKTNCNGGVPYAPSYSYDKAGNLTNYANGIASGPGVMQFTTAYDVASRVLSVSRDPAAPGGLSTNLFSAPTYTAAGSLAAALYGTDLHLIRKYDSRLRIAGEIDTAGGSSTPHPATAGTATLKIYGQEQTQ